MIDQMLHVACTLGYFGDKNAFLWSYDSNTFREPRIYTSLQIHHNCEVTHSGTSNFKGLRLHSINSHLSAL